MNNFLATYYETTAIWQVIKKIFVVAFSSPRKIDRVVGNKQQTKHSIPSTI